MWTDEQCWSGGKFRPGTKAHEKRIDRRVGRRRHQRKGYMTRDKGTNPGWFEPGKSGNPGGVKKGYQRQDKILQRLSTLSPEEFEKYEPKTIGERKALLDLKRAMRSAEYDVRVEGYDDKGRPYVQDLREGPAWSALVSDRMDGKPGQTTDVNVDIDGRTGILFGREQNTSITESEGAPEPLEDQPEEGS